MINELDITSIVGYEAKTCKRYLDFIEEFIQRNEKEPLNTKYSEAIDTLRDTVNRISRGNH